MALTEWDVFWQEGNFHCLPQDRDDVIKQQTDALWLNLLVDLPLECHDKVLDIACGQGYVIQLLAESTTLPLSFTGMDGSSVDFSLPEQTPHSLTLLSNTLLDSHVELDEKFSLITSNFGAEYIEQSFIRNLFLSCSTEKTKVALNMHHPNSLLTKNSKKFLKALKLWLDDPSFLSLEASLENTFSVEKAKTYIDKLAILDKKTEYHLSGTQLSQQIVNMLVYYQKGKITRLAFQDIRDAYAKYMLRLSAQIDSSCRSEKVLQTLLENQSFVLLKDKLLKCDHRIVSRFVLLQRQ